MSRHPNHILDATPMLREVAKNEKKNQLKRLEELKTVFPEKFYSRPSDLFNVVWSSREMRSLYRKTLGTHTSPGLSERFFVGGLFEVLVEQFYPFAVLEQSQGRQVVLRHRATEVAMESINGEYVRQNPTAQRARRLTSPYSPDFLRVDAESGLLLAAVEAALFPNQKYCDRKQRNLERELKALPDVYEGVTIDLVTTKNNEIVGALPSISPNGPISAPVTDLLYQFFLEETYHRYSPFGAKEVLAIIKPDFEASFQERGRIKIALLNPRLTPSFI